MIHSIIKYKIYIKIIHLQNYIYIFLIIYIYINYKNIYYL